jgi:hypothetical protein
MSSIDVAYALGDPPERASGDSRGSTCGEHFVTPS